MRWLFGGVALTVSTSALAAPPQAMSLDWSGFYAGANVGGSWGRSSTDFSLSTIPVSSTTERMDGWLGGLQAGYNWQRDMFVLGLEADIHTLNDVCGVPVAPSPETCVSPVGVSVPNAIGMPPAALNDLVSAPDCH